MPEIQKLVTPLVESNIVLEPPTPPALPLNTRIQRVWSLLFGRRDNTLQPIYADRAGMLGVVALDLNGWTKVYDAALVQAWTDLGRIVDLVTIVGVCGAAVVPHLAFGMVTGTAIYRAVPVAMAQVNHDAAWWNLAVLQVHARVRWYEGTADWLTSSRVIAYTAPDR